MTRSSPSAFVLSALNLVQSRIDLMAFCFWTKYKWSGRGEATEDSKPGRKEETSGASNNVLWGTASYEASKYRFRGVDSKSRFGGLPEIEIQQKIANWKAESHSFSVSKELAPKDASIARYSDFESDHSAVGRLQYRAFGADLVNSAEGATPKESDAGGVSVKPLVLKCRFKIVV